ncbi:MAG: hypothetical protein ACE14M_09835 [Terriglobales bacterium]
MRLVQSHRRCHGQEQGLSAEIERRDGQAASIPERCISRNRAKLAFEQLEEITDRVLSSYDAALWAA